MPLSISQLPIEKIYRIFDQLNNKELFIFINHDNQRLNAILNSYPRFQTLTTLSLRGRGIGVADAQAIGQTLERNHKLTILDLEYNHIGDEGAQAISQALERNHTLTTLYLERSRIGVAGAQAIGQVLERNQRHSPHSEDNSWC